MFRNLILETYIFVQQSCNGFAPEISCCSAPAVAECEVKERRGLYGFYSIPHHYICICTHGGMAAPPRLLGNKDPCPVLLEELRHAWQSCVPLPAGVDGDDRGLCMEIGAQCAPGGFLRHRGCAGNPHYKRGTCRALCKNYHIENCYQRCLNLISSCAGWHP